MRNTTLSDLVNNSIDYQLVNDTVLYSNADSQFGEVGTKLFKFIVDYFENKEEVDITAFNIEEVLRYLKASHAYYLTKKLPEIEQSLTNYFNNSDESSQLLNALALFFNQYKKSFVKHILAEEREFFPYIQKLIDYSSGLESDYVDKQYIEKYSIAFFNEKHDSIEDELQSVSTIIFNNLGAKSIPLPFRVFLNQVELFELDLKKHAIIEDFLLVPLALKLESDIKSN